MNEKIKCSISCTVLAGVLFHAPLVVMEQRCYIWGSEQIPGSISSFVR